MIRGLYIAGTAMLENNQKIESTSNNIANSQTIAFKRDDVTVESFNDVLISKYNGTRYTTGKGVATVKDKVSKLGRHDTTVDNGYFRIQTDMGVSHNQHTRFAVNQEGYLSTYYPNSDDSINWRLGDRLIGRSGNPIYVGENDFTVEKNGAVLVNGKEIDNLVYRTKQNAIGTINAGVKATRVVVDYKQGQLNRTDKLLDVALDGHGFFVVNTPEGEFLTRDGRFKMAADHRLVTHEGYPIQGFNGDIKIPDAQITINEFGEFVYNGEIADKLLIKNYSNEGDLKKIAGYYKLRDNPTGKEIPFEGQVKQGFVEESNSDIIKEMIHLMSLQHNYEASQKVIHTHDQLLEKAISQIGVV